jgi:hypothetical protein
MILSQYFRGKLAAFRQQLMDHCFMQENAHEMEGGEKVDNYYVYSWTSCGFESDFPQPTTKSERKKYPFVLPAEKQLECQERKKQKRITI